MYTCTFYISLSLQIEDTDDYNSVDIQAVLLEMRQQRLGLIQTPDQLRFSYVAILQRIWKRMADAEDEKRSQEEEEEDDLPGSESEEIEDEEGKRERGREERERGRGEEREVKMDNG